MASGGVATAACRRDLPPNTLIGGSLFQLDQVLPRLLFRGAAPADIERVWSFDALSGIMPAGIPIEERVFGFAPGVCWSGRYEPLTCPAYTAARC